MLQPIETKLALGHDHRHGGELPAPTPHLGEDRLFRQHQKLYPVVIGVALHTCETEQPHGGRHDFDAACAAELLLDANGFELADREAGMIGPRHAGPVQMQRDIADQLARAIAEKHAERLASLKHLRKARCHEAGGLEESRLGT